MPVLIRWLGFILAFVFLFAIFLWFRTRKTSRFQSRLALLFFLFVIIPLTPLTLFLGRLLLKSTETFMLPGIDETLTLSLDVLKSQLNDRGCRFLQSVNRFSEITPEKLQQAGFVYAGEFSTNGHRQINIRLTPSAPAVDENRYMGFSELDIQQKVQEGELIIIGGQHYFESFAVKDSLLLFAGFQVSDQVVQAKDAVSSSLQRYTTLLLLRERMVEQNIIWIILVILILFIAVLSVLLAGRVSSEVSNPLLKLTEGMKRIGAGDLNFRVQAVAKDEIAYLIESFNRMAEELRISRENLQRAERAAAWRDVARQISHEIKNPLTPIEFSIYRLETTLPEAMRCNHDLSEALTVITAEIAAIRRIADTFSQFARLPHTELKSADVVEVVRSAVELLRNNEAGVTIDFQAPPALPPIPLDIQQFRGVMNNLIKNAIEASGNGARVEVIIEEATNGEHKICIRVIDHGSGMDEPTLQHIFDPYFTTKTGGSGIGLFLAARIIADHGGVIKVDSRPGEGSTFTILL
jgi:nitrogen fixation/metabolism regulation signal transduction histidine kinase